MITVQASKPLHIRLPRVYRYLNDEYISRFFESGVIRISSFEVFRKYNDEVRGDSHEGHGGVTGVSVDGATQFHNVPLGVDEGAYMLSASLVSSEDLQGKFYANSYFTIEDPLGLFFAISNAIPGIVSGCIGSCNYLPTVVISKKIHELSRNDFQDDQGRFSIGPKMMGRANQIIGNDHELLFLKEDKYQYQSEFRFVWKINAQFFKLQSHFDVECKEAIQFCKKRV